VVRRVGPATPICGSNNVTYSACIDWLYADGDRPFADRVRAAAADGMTAVEFWDWRGRDLDATRAACDSTGLTVTSFIAEPRGDLTDPSTHTTFVRGVAESAKVAQQLGCQSLMVFAGTPRPDTTRAEQHANVVSGLLAGARVAADFGMTLLLEPLNTRIDHPDSFLDTTSEALDIIGEVNQPSLRLLYDVYHSAVMGEDLVRTIQQAASVIGHVQIADSPGRHEPGTGTIDWTAVRQALDAAGYEGLLGLEYQPVKDTETSTAMLRSTVPEGRHAGTGLSNDRAPLPTRFAPANTAFGGDDSEVHGKLP
jgi:hydroxypyruvate isomerase